MDSVSFVLVLTMAMTSMIPHVLVKNFIRNITPKRSSRRSDKNNKRLYSLSTQKLVRVHCSHVYDICTDNNILGRRHLVTDLSIVRKLDFDAPYFDEEDDEGVELTTPVRKRLLDSGAASRGRLCLGKGTFGNVIKAKYRGERVAAKLINLSNNEDFLPTSKRLQSLLREYNGIGLHHPNIARILFIEQSTKHGLVVVERCTSTSLQTLLSQGFATSYQEKIRIATEISQAIDFCHKNHILHLDVKPLNVLIDSIGHCKLTDFGNSVIDNCFGKYSNMGTLHYVAPEILRQKAPTTKADIYSLGITMWQIMSGDIPYRQLNYHAIIYQVVHKKQRPHELPRPLQMVNWSVFQGYTNLYEHCWMTKPEDRPSAEQVIGRLRDLTNPKYRVDPATFVID